jgi:hypothetical protein
MPTLAIYCKEDELKMAITVLRESATQKLSEARELERQGNLENPDTGALMSSEVRATANKYLAAARDLEWSVEGLANQPTLDEEKAELRQIVDELFKDGGFRTVGTLAEQVRSGVEAVRRQRQEAFGAAATLVDDQRVRLEAMRWVLKSALDCPTHKSKDARLRLALEAVEEIGNQLQKIDPDEIDHYTHYNWKVESWNTRKLTAQVYRQEQQIRELQEQLNARKPED